MRPATVVACFAALVVASRTFGQSNDGYVGVFGDAGGTIRCIEAPPWVPFTLYVVAKTSGRTVNGISGAEFRIEFSNPSGYVLNYTAPGNALLLGDPLSSTGFNITFYSCQTPDSGAVSLGTISGYNFGSGGQCEIIVKRRNPPRNPTYQCALLVHCDDPAFTQSCNTAPADTSCIMQKTRSGEGGVLSDDEFATFLDGYQAQLQYAAWEGYTCYKPDGCTGAAANITTTFPWRVDVATKVWVGIANAGKQLANSKWIQAGYARRASETMSGYYEYTTNLGYPSGYSGATYTSEEPTTPDGAYTVRKNGLQTIIFTAGTAQNAPAWSSFEGALGIFNNGFFGAEKGDVNDCVPGCSGEECTFSNAVVFDNNVIPQPQDFSSDYCDYHSTEYSDATGQGYGTFKIYDTRSACCPFMLGGREQ